MVRLNETELEQLNALVDGELEAVDAAHWRRRIASDADVAAEYDRIARTKAAIASLTIEDVISMPTAAQAAGAATARRARIRTSHLAIAASVAGVIVFGGIAQLFQTAPSSSDEASRLHASLTANEYEVSPERNPLTVVSAAASDIPLPDLRSSNLFLVDVKRLGDDLSSNRIALHYSGLSGCRLTIWMAEGETMEVARSFGAFRRWNVGDWSIAVVATGMDESRFESIADYVEVVSRQLETDDVRVAMQEAYRSATRCS